MLHMKKSAHDFILESLELEESQSIYLSKYGHIGQFDQIIIIIPCIGRRQNQRR